MKSQRPIRPPLRIVPPDAWQGKSSEGRFDREKPGRGDRTGGQSCSYPCHGPRHKSVTQRPDVVILSRMRVATTKLALGGLVGAVSVCWVGCSHAPLPQHGRPEQSFRDGKIVLGSPHLTCGIPGEGPLTLDQIETWLADEDNHRPLDFLLPLGLADAAELVRVPDDNPLTRAKIELGRQLFFDKRLSGLGTFSCATCHQPDQYYPSHLVMPEVGRNASAVFNRILGSEQFWDGHAASLESQPSSPIANPFEMNSSPEKTTAAVAAIEGYARQLEVIFGEASFANICRALASFERAIVTGPAPWDYQRLLRKYAQDAGETTAESTEEIDQLTRLAEQHPMSAAALRGATLFFGDRARCGYCHTGPNLTDEQYHNLGVGMASPSPDEGRRRVTGKVTDSGAFRTPSLRNVAHTAPYMHNGKFGSLEKVIEFLDQGGYAHKHLSPIIRPLHLTADEKTDLVEFLRSLTSVLPPVETGRLPE